jgi:copper chaperone CopZ
MPAMTVKEILAQLEAKGDEARRKHNTKAGAPDNQFGVKLGDIRTLAKKVKAVEGVADCTVDLQGERATVGMDDAKRTQAVIDVVKKLGYEVEPIDESAPAPSTEPTAPAAEPTAPATTPAT